MEQTPAAEDDRPVAGAVDPRSQNAKVLVPEDRGTMWLFRALDGREGIEFRGFVKFLEGCMLEQAQGSLVLRRQRVWVGMPVERSRESRLKSATADRTPIQKAFSVTVEGTPAAQWKPTSDRVPQM